MPQRAFQPADGNHHEKRIDAIQNGPQSVGIHVVRFHAVAAEQEGVNKYEYGERFQTFDGISEKDEEKQEADQHDRWSGNIQIFHQIAGGEVVGTDEMPFEDLVLVDGDVGG